jgi:single-stranded DNA-binding protein
VDPRFSADGDELRGAHRATTRRREHQIRRIMRPTSQVGAQLLSDRAAVSSDRAAVSGRREQELSFFTVVVWRD